MSSSNKLNIKPNTVIKYQKVSNITCEKLIALMYYEHILYVSKVIIELLELDEAEASRISEHIKNRSISLITTNKLKDYYNILKSKSTKATQ
jgi:hypothetical protein